MLMLTFWQRLPTTIDPIAFSVGFFSASWYAILYLAGIAFAGAYLFRLAWKRRLFETHEAFFSWLSFILWGVLIGARLGFVFFYGDVSYFEEPWRIVSPYDFSTETWVGIRGMSFFGGLLGGAVTLLWYARRYTRSFLELSDILVMAIPIGLFFGRLGNFLNGELWGTVTNLPWGMQYSDFERVLRHPSQLYEAFGEGVLLFLLLLFFQGKGRFRGEMTALFLIAYGMIRFLLEFWRMPDPESVLFAGSLHPNQLLAFSLILLGFWLYQGIKAPWYNVRKKEE